MILSFLICVALLVLTSVERGIFVVTQTSLSAVMSDPVTPPIIGYTVDSLGRMLAFETVELTATPLIPRAGGSQRLRGISNASGYFIFDSLVIESCAADNETFTVSFNTSAATSNVTVAITVMPNAMRMKINPFDIPDAIFFGEVVPRMVFSVCSSCGSPLSHVPQGGAIQITGNFTGQRFAPLTGNLSEHSNGSSMNLFAAAVFTDIRIDELRDAAGNILTSVLFSVYLTSSDGSTGTGAFPVRVMPSERQQKVRVAFWLTDLPPPAQQLLLRAAVQESLLSITSDNASHFDQTEVIADFVSARKAEISIAQFTSKAAYLVIVSNCSVENVLPGDSAPPKVEGSNTVAVVGGRLILSTANGVDVNPRGILYALSQRSFVSSEHRYSLFGSTPVGNFSSRTHFSSFMLGPQGDLGAEVGDTVTLSLSAQYFVSPYVPYPQDSFRFHVFPDSRTVLEQSRSFMSIAAIVNPDIAFISTLIVQLDCANGQSGALDFAIHPLQFGIGANAQERYRRSAQVCNIMIVVFSSLLSVVAHLLLPLETRQYYVPHIALWISRVLFPGTVFASLSMFGLISDAMDYTLFSVGILFAVFLPALSANMIRIVCPKFLRRRAFPGSLLCIYKVMAPLGDYQVQNSDHLTFRCLFSELQGTKYRKYFFIVDYCVWITAPVVSVIFPCESRHVYILVLVASQLLIVVVCAPYITIGLNALHVLSGGVKTTALIYLMWPNQGRSFRNIMSALICVLSPASILFFLLRNIVPWIVGHLRGSNDEAWRVTFTKPDHSLALLMSELDLFAADPDDPAEHDVASIPSASLKAETGAVGLDTGSAANLQSVASEDGSLEKNVSLSSFGSQEHCSRNEGARPVASCRNPHSASTIKEAKEHWQRLLLSRAARLDELKRDFQNSRFATPHGYGPQCELTRVYFSQEQGRFVESRMDDPNPPLANPGGARAEVPRSSSEASRGPFTTRLREGSPLQRRFLELQTSNRSPL
jgi:hypothetical protein